MQVNATLIVQILNFIVAYFLLKTLFFKPALRIVDQEQASRKNLLDAIDVHNKEIEQKELKLQQHVLGYREEFSKEIPSAEHEIVFIFKDIMPQISYPEISAQELKRCTDEVIPSLRAKVENVRR
jgi:F0F1-type ATP synthase membrane subunit b/b'